MRKIAIALLVWMSVAANAASDNPGFDPTLPLFAGGIWNTVPNAACPRMSLDFFQSGNKQRGTVTIAYADNPSVSGGGSWSIKGHSFTIKTYMDTLHGTVRGKTLTATYRTLTDGKEGPPLSCNFTTE
jgi:hypothetical protein